MKEGQGLRVWLIEDQPAEVYLVRRAVTESGLAWTVEVSKDGGAARRRAQQQEGGVDLVLLDLNLPVHNGFEVLSELRGLPDWKSAPVVMFTTSSHETDITRSYELGANCFVRKPDDFVGLCKVLRELTEFWNNVAVRPRAS